MTPTVTSTDRGRRADIPTQVPARGWKDVLTRVKVEAKQDNVSLLGGGVAFFGLLALIPALVALVSLYGLFADPADVERQMEDTLTAAPAEVRAVSLAFTLGAILFVVVSILLIAVLPSVLADTGLGTAGRFIVGGLRWVLLFVAMLLGLSLLYRYGPDRDGARCSWVSPGAILATVLWLIGSVGFAIYTATFG